MPDPRPEFTPKEQAVFEQMKQICAKPGRKNLQTMQSCALLKNQQMLEFDQRQAQIKALALDARLTRQLGAVGYVSARMNRIQVQGMLLSNALKKASIEYDSILTTRASKPIMGEIVFTIILTALPELKLIGGAFGLFANGAQAGGKIGTLVEGLSETIKPESMFDLVGQFYDNQAKDIIEAIKNPLSAQADVDAETQQRLSAFNSKNHILTNLIKSIERKLILIDRFEPSFYAYIISYQETDLLPFLEAKFKEARFDDAGPYDPQSFEIFADLILYDMLRIYCRHYCVASVGMVSAGARFEDVIGRSHSFEGMDEEQQRMIFEKFGAGVWRKRPGYPALNDSRDLVRHLGVRTVSTLTKQPVNLETSFIFRN